MFFRKSWRDRDSEGSFWGDIKAFFGPDAAINWKAAIFALAVPTIIAVAFLYNNPKVEWEDPEVFFVKHYPANRTIEEIRAQQAKDLPAELAAVEEEKKAEAAKRAEFRKLGQMMGMDVDEAAK